MHLFAQLIQQQCRKQCKLSSNLRRNPTRLPSSAKILSTLLFLTPKLAPRKCLPLEPTDQFLPGKAQNCQVSRRSQCMIFFFATTLAL
jgi:hypothetical protein